jgi:hypothetical protein
VTGLPSFPARTIFAWSGPERPSADTSSPDSPSLLANPFMNAMWAFMSCGDQRKIWYGPPPSVFIISMYFMVDSF